jgi:hypothetical protein
VLCVAPTVGTLAWCAAAALPSNRTAAEAALGSITELVVTIDSLSYPRPGVARYRGIELADPESHRILAHVDWAEHRRAAEGSVLVLSAVEVDAERLARLATLVDRQLRLLHTAGQPPLRWTADQVTLGAAHASTTLARVAGEIVAGETTSRAALRFSLPEATSREPVRLLLERTRGADASETRCELHTGGAPLPLASIVPMMPSLAHLGDRAEFAGQLWGATKNGAWSGELTGNLTHVDLDALVTQQFPHALSGEAHVTLQKLAFQAGRMTTLAGRIEAGPGTASRSLLEAGIESLGMAPGERVSATDQRSFAYRQLALTFALDAAQLHVEGAGTSAAAPMAVMIDASGAPLLTTPSRRPQPSLALLRFLVPPGRWQVPATAETEWLLQSLPVPSAKSESGIAPTRAALRDVAPAGATTD